MTIPSLRMEVKKDGLRQTQDGTWKLSLTVHPNDMSVALMQADMGTRFMCAMAQIGDDEQPVERKPKTHSRTKAAVMACKDVEFQKWVAPRAGYVMEELSTERREHWAKQAVYTLCKIGSRSELDTNPEAGKRWDNLWEQFKRRDQIR